MSTRGIGAGLADGVKMAGSFMLPAMQHRSNQEFQLAWARGLQGMGLDDAPAQPSPSAAISIPQEGAPGSASAPEGTSQVGRFEVPGQPITAMPKMAPPAPAAAQPPQSRFTPAQLLSLSQVARPSRMGFRR
jgi:hypothetical protein